MNQEPYLRKISVFMVPHIWIGAGVGPFYFYFGLDDFTEMDIYLSLFFISVTIYSISQGWYAYQHREYSDFAVLAVVPVILPMILLWVYLSK